MAKRKADSDGGASSSGSDSELDSVCFHVVFSTGFVFILLPKRFREQLLCNMKKIHFVDRPGCMLQSGYGIAVFIGLK